MGLILDSSLLIADERGHFDMGGFLQQFPEGQPIIAAITAFELLNGIERAQDAGRKARRRAHVEELLRAVAVQPFDLAQARLHSRIWAGLAACGQTIGAHDMLIAAAGMAFDHDIATLNLREFQRVPELKLLDATPFLR